MRYKYYKKKTWSFWFGLEPNQNEPNQTAYRGLSRPTSVFHTTIGVSKILSRWARFGSTRAKKTCFGVKKNRAYTWPSIITTTTIELP